jgi:hypothetical protein
MAGLGSQALAIRARCLIIASDDSLDAEQSPNVDSTGDER